MVNEQLTALGFELEDDGSAEKTYDSPHQVVEALVALKGQLIAVGFTAEDEYIEDDSVVCEFASDTENVTVTQIVPECTVNVFVSTVNVFVS